MSATDIVPIQRIAQAIFVLRGQKVMLDYDLATLYGVEARVLNQAVKRNASRFPVDFMFQISAEEMEKVSQVVTPPAQERTEKKVTNSSQFVTSSRKYRGKRYRPYAFKIDAILEAIRQLMAPPTKPRREIGFHVREKAPRYRARKLR
jgi:hypothetical protein